jgi:protease IV
MKSRLIVLLLIFVVCSTNAQQSFSSYRVQNYFGMTSPGAMKYGLYGNDNPALLAQLESPDILFTWSDQTAAWNKFSHWGLFTAFPYFGFSAINQRNGGWSVTDYRLSLAAGNETFSIGSGYGWSSGDADRFLRSDIFTLGILIRPNKFISAGASAFIPTVGSSEAMVDLGIRPLGNELITVFGDYVFSDDEQETPIDFLDGNFSQSGKNRWSIGAAAEVFPGIRFTGRYFENKSLNFGAQLSLGNISFSSVINFDQDKKHSHNIYGIRLGGYDRNPFQNLGEHKKYIEMDLIGATKYQRFKFFDNSKTLLLLLEQIDAARNDNTVGGIAINTSGMVMNREMLWEIRERIKEFKESGKKVAVFIDRAGIDHYHLASAADYIVMDPQGMLILEGFLLGRSFYKGTLEKLGIGFSEWRYFKYKSALENFSEDKMSEADREQRQAIVDDYYALAKNDITKGRKLSAEIFDNLVNDSTIFLSQAALENGLIDKIGRWDELKELINEKEGSKHFVNPNSLKEFKKPNDYYWGSKPEIAVIYAIGVCAMDEGINARSLVKDINKAADDPNIKAIVLRVDSPGGDAMASDIIAEALRKSKEKKPVIVSQGYVAASGGYWLSMYADTIVAAPNSLTGSIGVIGGWFYNKGLKEELGISTDFVKRGDHADLGFGFSIPLLNLSLIPDRDLTPDEQKKAEHLIKVSYNEFVSKVALSRNMDFESVEIIGEGRVWTGLAGIKNGLIDKLGGLADAINIASEKAGLKGKEFNIIEYPDAPLINLNLFAPKIIGVKNEANKLLENLNFRLKNNGIPMPIVPIEFMEIVPEF